MSKKNNAKNNAKKKTWAPLIAAAAVLLVVVIVLIIALSSKTYIADITVEGYGTITVELDSKSAPKTVKNFVSLAESGFYDGLTFHRIVPGFVIQGGDPLGNGTGGPGWHIPGEFAANGFKNDLQHVRGVLSWARAQDPNSAGSQFFIMVECLVV